MHSFVLLFGILFRASPSFALNGLNGSQSFGLHELPTLPVIGEESLSIQQVRIYNIFIVAKLWLKIVEKKQLSLSSKIQNGSCSLFLLFNWYMMDFGNGVPKDEVACCIFSSISCGCDCPALNYLQQNWLAEIVNVFKKIFRNLLYDNKYKFWL